MTRTDVWVVKGDSHGRRKNRGMEGMGKVAVYTVQRSRLRFRLYSMCQLSRENSHKMHRMEGIG